MGVRRCFMSKPCIFLYIASDPGLLGRPSSQPPPPLDRFQAFRPVSGAQKAVCSARTPQAIACSHACAAWVIRWERRRVWVGTGCFVFIHSCMCMRPRHVSPGANNKPSLHVAAPARTSPASQWSYPDAAWLGWLVATERCGLIGAGGWSRGVVGPS